MTQHAQFADALALYALGALDDQRELAELQAHLGTCGECRRELEALRADAALLALSAVGPQPPQRSRERLMRAVAAEPRREMKPKSRVVLGRLRSRWLSFAPIAVALLLVIISGVLVRENYRLRNNNEKLRAQISSEVQSSAHARAVLEVLNSQNTQKMVLVAAKEKPQPQVKTIYEEEKGRVLLLASNLAPLPADKVYELWLLPASGGAPMPAGIFKPDANGNSVMLQTMGSDSIAAKGFAITIENSGGSPVPTSPVVFAPAG
jgi:branched-subunit amino acid transport protein